MADWKSPINCQIPTKKEWIVLATLASGDKNLVEISNRLKPANIESYYRDYIEDEILAPMAEKDLIVKTDDSYGLSEFAKKFYFAPLDHQHGEGFAEVSVKLNKYYGEKNHFIIQNAEKQHELGRFYSKSHEEQVLVNMQKWQESWIRRM